MLYRVKPEVFDEVQKLIQKWWETDKSPTISLTYKHNQITIASNTSTIIIELGDKPNTDESADDIFQIIYKHTRILILVDIPHINIYKIYLDDKFYLSTTCSITSYMTLEEAKQCVYDKVQKTYGYSGKLPEFDAFIEKAYATSAKIQAIPHISSKTRDTNIVATAIIDHYVPNFETICTKYQRLKELNYQINESLKKLSKDNMDDIEKYIQKRCTLLKELSLYEKLLFEKLYYASYTLIISDISSIYHNIMNFVDDSLLYSITIPNSDRIITFMNILLYRHDPKSDIGLLRMNSLYDLVTKDKNGIPAYYIDTYNNKLYISLV